MADTTDTERPGPAGMALAGAEVPRPRPPSTSAWRDNWKHLRAPFQLTLAPIFLWGWSLSGTRLGWRTLPAFAAFHFLLYTGITAYNSYFDRDEGPIGGLERPPRVRESLLPVALGLQAAGLALALPYGAAFTEIYLAFVLLSVLYSHPRFRWKADPVLSALVVCGGQGGLGFLAGWAAARGEIQTATSALGLLAAASAALTTLGMYPLTQVYQIEEDARRGDRTLCVALGARGGLVLSQVVLAAAGLVSAYLAVRFFTRLDAAVLGAAYLVQLARVEGFKRRNASLTCSEAFRTVMALSYGSSAAFLLFILARLARW